MWIPSTWLTVIAPTVVFGGSAVAWGMLHPRSRITGPLVFRGLPTDDGDPPRVALTFDDGPTPDSTPAVLDALQAVDAPAAFFVIGLNVLHHPQLLRRIDDEGHLIGNHSFDHHRQGWRGLSGYWRAQIDDADDAVHDLIGKRPAMFRPPSGIKHWPLMAEAQYSGHAVVTWARRANDGRKKTIKKQRLVKRLIKAKDGDVLRLHDGHEPGRTRSRQTTADAVVALVNQLRDRGFEIVRLDELLNLPAYQPEPENTQEIVDDLRLPAGW